MAKSRERIVPALACSMAISMAVQVPFSVSATQAASPAVQTAMERSSDASAGPSLPAGAWNADELLASPEVVKEASPQPVMDGAQLTYTLHVTNTGAATLTATITDVLPAQVIPSGSQTWTALIKAGRAWTQALAVTVTEGYSGPLTNRAQVTTAEGARGITSVTTCANLCTAVLPVVLREYSSRLPPREWDPRLDNLGVKSSNRPPSNQASPTGAWWRPNGRTPASRQTGTISLSRSWTRMGHVLRASRWPSNGPGEL